MSDRKSKFWRQREVIRRREFRAMGMSKNDAKSIARWEIEQRRKIAKLTGDLAAADAALVLDGYEDGSCIPRLLVHRDLIPDELTPAVHAWASIATPTQH